jgi:hypothetical protein
MTEFTTHVTACAACGEDHPEMKFTQRPEAEREQNPEYPYQGECPSSGKILYLRITTVGHQVAVG